MLRIVFLFFLFASLTVQANTASICVAELERAESLEAQNIHLAEKLTSLRALNRGESIRQDKLWQLFGSDENITEQIQQLRLEFDAQPIKNPAFETPLCDKEAERLIELQQINLRLSTEYQQLMTRFLSLPDSNLLSLLELSKIQHQLHKALQTFISDNAAETAAIEQATQLTERLNQQIDKLFAAFLFIEPPSLHTLTRHAELMSLDLQLNIEDKKAIHGVDALQNALDRTRIMATHLRVRLHHTVWAQLSFFNLLQPKSIVLLPDLLLRESHLFRWHLQQTLLETQLNIKQSNAFFSDSVTAVLISSVLSGLLLILLLFNLTKQSEKLIYWLHKKLVDKVKTWRWAVRFANLFSRVGVLAPWLILWTSLSWLATALIHYEQYALLWALPFLQIVILYRLLSLSLEWLIFKVANSAGSFLNTEQSEKLQNMVKKSAYIIVTPWALTLLIDKVLGPSLTLQLAEFITFFIIYFAIALLLKERPNDFLSNIERVLARSLSDTQKQFLKGPIFYLLAPALLVVQLVYIAILTVISLLQDFDWYRRLSARWFWLRTRHQTEKKEETTPQIVNENYKRWFVGNEVDDKPLPMIDSGLSPTICRPIEFWIEDQTNENTLLVTGEKGIGKSTALSQVEKTLTEKHSHLQITRHTIDTKITTALEVRQLVSSLLSIDITESNEPLSEADENLQPTLIILDECQDLFLAQLHGLEAWKALIDITNTRLDNVFWLLVINNQSFAYLNNVFGRQYHIRNVIHAKPWSQSNIRSLILSRNHLSGFKLTYDEVLLNSFGPQQNTGRSAEQRFFSLLWDSCKGVPKQALALWLSAIRTRGLEIMVGLPNLPDASALDDLGDDLLFVYRAIISHENISFYELLSVTGQAESLIRYALKTGADIGFLDHNSKQRYCITPIWYFSLVNFLSRKNMTHE